MATVICGDSVEKLPGFRRATFDFAFADPPFNIGQDYAGYSDKVDAASYRRRLNNVVRELARVVRPGGVICLHGPDDVAECYLAIANSLHLDRIAWVNWHYRFGQCSRSNWIDARCHCLVYRNGGDQHTWNPDDVLVESDRVKYGDKRVNETERGGKRLPGTVWGVPSDGPYFGRVQGNNKERRPGHPNQLPEVYLERLIKAYTRPGDRIIDPYGGSGTTAVVAEALGRHATTIDISAANCESIKERLQEGAKRIKGNSLV